jgi:hypothetical protein
MGTEHNQKGGHDEKIAGPDYVIIGAYLLMFDLI